MESNPADVLFRFVSGTPLHSTQRVRQSAKITARNFRRTCRRTSLLRRCRVAGRGDRADAVIRSGRFAEPSLENPRVGDGGFLRFDFMVALAVSGLEETAST